MSTFQLYCSYLIATLPIVFSQSLNCELAFDTGCFNKTLDLPDDDLNCHGKGSCSHSLILDMENGHWMGSRSGQNIILNSTSTSPDTASGYFSLAWTLDFIALVNDHTLECEGESSCYSISNGNGNHFDCHSLRSCESSSFTGTAIDIYGMYGFRHSIFTSRLSNSIRIDMEGFYGGYNASIYCKIFTNKICNMFCSGNGCENLNYFCDMNSTCTVDCMTVKV